MPGKSDNSRSAIVFAVIGHALVVAALTFSLPLQTRQRAPVVVPIDAILIDEQAVAREQQRLEEEAAERVRLQREAEEAEQRRLDDLAREQEAAAEAARQQQQAEAERVRQQEAEQQRQQALEAERREEAVRAEQERQAREAEARALAEAERRAVELERQQQAAAEAAARQAALEQAERERDLQAALQAEEDARRARDSPLRDQYISSIRNKIQQRWIRPPSAGDELECVLTVTQIPSGEVVDVVIGRCNGDAAVVRSIENAVLAASPLPRPPVPELFQRTLIITFKPDDSL